jgi:hypothetical protein
MKRGVAPSVRGHRRSPAARFVSATRRTRVSCNASRLARACAAARSPWRLLRTTPLLTPSFGRVFFLPRRSGVRKPDAEERTDLPAPAVGVTPQPGRSIAVAAGGCFWSVELAFQRTPGVTRTAVGYCQGATPNPTYESVCSGRTGHTEAVLIEYDPAVVSYDSLCDVLWSKIDATQVRMRYGCRATLALVLISALSSLQPARRTARGATSGASTAPVCTTLTMRSAPLPSPAAPRSRRAWAAR